MLENSIFYLSSTAAQVWVALMIFQVLVLRDASAQIMAEIDSLVYRIAPLAPVGQKPLTRLF